MAGTSVQDFHLRSDLQERYKGTNIQECLGTAFKRSVRWNVCGAHFQRLKFASGVHQQKCDAARLLLSSRQRYHGLRAR